MKTHTLRSRRGAGSMLTALTLALVPATGVAVVTAPAAVPYPPGVRTLELGPHAQAQLVVPEGPPRPRPLLVFFHGAGGTAAQSVALVGDPATARAHVADYLARSGAGRRYPGLGYQVTTDGDSVQVRMSAPLDLPLVPPGWAGRTTVSSDAAAVTVVTR